MPTNLADVVAVAAGGRHSVALKRDGTLALWGNNTLGQITNAPSNLTNVCAVAAGLWHTMALRADGTVAAWGDLFIRTNPVPAGLSNVIAIAAGPRVCLALQSDHTVVAWGYDWAFLNNFLPTNVPGTLTNVISIAAGMLHNQALLRDGTIYTWGQTNNGGQAVPSGLTNVLGMSAGWHYGAAVDQEGRLIRWGPGQSAGAQGFNAVVSMSAGGSHGLMIRTNNDGPIIRVQPKNIASPRGVSTNLSVGATSALTLSYQWLKNGTNIAGATSSTLSFPDFQDTDDGSYWVRVSTSAGEVISRVARVETIHAPVITNQVPELNLRRAQGVVDALAVFATNKGPAMLSYNWYKDGTNISGPSSMSRFWGLRFSGVEIEGDYQVVVSNVAGSATSAVWTVKITLRGEATGWGDSAYGRLNSPRQETNLVALAAGGYHTLGLRENGTVTGWGTNQYQQLSIPSGLSNVTAIAANCFHSVALKEDGTAVAWGGNGSGQTTLPGGLNNVGAIAAGCYTSYFLKRDGTLASAGAYPPPSGLSNVMAIAAGDSLGMALLSNGTVSVWNVASPPGGLTNVVAIAAGAYHCLALKQEGTVVGWGANTYGETTAPGGLNNVMKISAGLGFSMALKNDDTIVAWGLNDLGQTNVPTGLGDTYAISAGYYHAVALAYDATLNYPVTVSQDLLLIYNTNSTDSVFVKDYYLAHRPMVAEANVIGVGCPAVEIYTNRVTFTNDIVTPVQNWLAANPTKRPQYYVLFLGIPSRINDPTNSNAIGVPVSLWGSVPGRKPFITSINMGATNTNDCVAYINKLEYFGTNYSPGRVVISASLGGYGNTNYYFDDTRYYLLGSLNDVGLSAKTGVLETGVAASSVFYSPSNGPTLFTCTNVTAYMGWGQYNNISHVATSGVVNFTGQSSWYIMQTIESFNGQWIPSSNPFMSSFIDWFSSGAFGGSNYVHSSVGAVSHLEEPTLPGVNDGSAYFGLWAGGKLFSICAWQSRRTPHFQAVGDPLLKR